MQPALTLPLTVTAGVLAGGAGLRMGGADKGLLMWRGQPLVAHVLAAARPQSAQQLISANRNRAAYAALGVPVLADASGQGPLAGLATLLAAAEPGWLWGLPCDAPIIPADLAARLLACAQAAQAPAAFLHDGERAHPSFCAVRTGLALSARQAAECGTGLGTWLRAQGVVPLYGAAPVNLNTPQDWQALPP